jgi:hypothetical protein
MISRAALEDVIGDYEHALRLFNEGASILDDASLSAVQVTGQFGPTASQNLITSANNVCGDLTRALHTLTNVLMTRTFAT